MQPIPAITFNVCVDWEDWFSFFIFPSEAFYVEVVRAVVFCESGFFPGLQTVVFDGSTRFIGWRLSESFIITWAESHFTSKFTEIEETIIRKRCAATSFGRWAREGNSPVCIKTLSSQILVRERNVRARHEGAVQRSIVTEWSVFFSDFTASINRSGVLDIIASFKTGDDDSDMFINEWRRNVSGVVKSSKVGKTVERESTSVSWEAPHDNRGGSTSD